MSQETPEKSLTVEEENAQLKQENVELRKEKQEWLEEKDRLIEERDSREKDAITDDLTGVFNKRGLKEMAKALLPRDEMWGDGVRDAAKERRRYVVGMFDLDDFKKLNTEYGHIKADKVLKEAAQVLKGFVRESDVVGRFGGEEFVVIFTDATSEHIKARLLDEETGKWKVSFTTIVDGESIPSSFSGGITEIGEDETAKDLEAIMERANQAMRHAKASGKNRVADFEESLTRA